MMPRRKPDPVDPDTDDTTDDAPPAPTVPLPRRGSLAGPRRSR